MQKQKLLEKAYSQVFQSSKFYDSAKIYAKRRQNLLKKLDSFCVFVGMPMDPGSEEAWTETWNHFVQEPAFLYLTGVNQAGCFLLLDPVLKTETLFVSRKDPFKEFWNGKRIGYLEGEDEVACLTGIKNIRPADEFWTVMRKLVTDKRYPNHAYAFFFERFKGDHNDRFSLKLRTILARERRTLKSVADLHWKFRLPLEEGRVAEAKAAQKVTDKAFRTVLPQVRNMKNERELYLKLNYEMQRLGDGDLAFPTICASGANACCLHYVKNDEQIKKNSLILLDFGIRIGTLHSDLSRTIPASGRFNPLQKLLYQIVLDSAREYQKFVKPGVSLRSIGQVPWQFILRELENRLVKKHQGKFKLLYDMRPHGVSHFIGEQIHEGDPGSRSLDVVLEPGMLISCEPGLYGTFSGVFNGKRFSEKIGIRIEDDLLITKNSFENISRHIPKEIAEIEKLMG